MAANGISTLLTKAAKQLAKLNIAQAKRQGKTVAVNGTVTGTVDSTKPYYRYWNTYNINDLPTKYTGNAVTDNANAGGLAAHRPWATNTGAAPITSYVGTLNSVTSENPFNFNVLKSANPGMAAAIANTGWKLNWTDARFTNGTFYSQQVNVKTQTETTTGFSAGNLTQDATYYTFSSWFGASGGNLPLGTQFTITW
jgi:hypothetical protein